MWCPEMVVGANWLRNLKCPKAENLITSCWQDLLIYIQLKSSLGIIGNLFGHDSSLRQSAKNNKWDWVARRVVWSAIFCLMYRIRCYVGSPSSLSMESLKCIDLFLDPWKDTENGSRDNILMMSTLRTSAISYRCAVYGDMLSSLPALARV